MRLRYTISHPVVILVILVICNITIPARMYGEDDDIHIVLEHSVTFHTVYTEFGILGTPSY